MFVGRVIGSVSESWFVLCDVVEVECDWCVGEVVLVFEGSGGGGMVFMLLLLLCRVVFIFIVVFLWVIVGMECLVVESVVVVVFGLVRGFIGV